jgi:hypothetical protein
MEKRLSDAPLSSMKQQREDEDRDSNRLQQNMTKKMF